MKKHILWEADRLESLGVGSISADWERYVCMFFVALQNELDQQERRSTQELLCRKNGINSFLI